MDLKVGQRVQLRKKHPCGGDTFIIMKTGMDFRLKCENCGSQIRLDRPEVLKRIKKII